MRLLHFADLHLDAPFAWADPHTSALRRQNRRRTLEEIIRLAADEHVDALLCGGDLFEQDRIGPDTVEFLRRTLAGAPCPVYLAPGNHDWYGPRSPYAQVPWPSNVHVFTDDRLVPRELASGVRLWGAAHRAPANTDDFFAGFEADGDALHLVLAHASERGGILWQEQGKQPHAAFDAAELEAAGIDYAFLGHYHTPRDADRFTYPGNPDPLEFGETGVRGAVLATFDADADRPRIERRRVAKSEVHDLVVEVTGASDRDDVAGRVRDILSGVAGCARVTLSGELGPAVQLDLGALTDLGGHLDGLVVRARDVTYTYDLEALEAEQTVRGQFIRDARAQIIDDDLLRRVILTGLRALDGRSDLDVA